VINRRSYLGFFFFQYVLIMLMLIMLISIYYFNRRDKEMMYGILSILKIIKGFFNRSIGK